MVARASGLTVAVVFVLAGPAWAGTPGELSLLAEHTESSVDQLETEAQSLAFRWVSGGSFGLRAEIPLLRVRSSSGLLRTGAGPVSLMRRNGQSSGSGGNGDGSGGGGGAGGGNGQPGHAGGTGGPYASASADDGSSGLGDILLAAGHTLAGGGVRLFHVDAGVQVKTPTADEEQGLGTGEWDYRAGVSGEYRFWSVTGFGGVGWNRLGDPSWIELNDAWDAYLGLEGYAFGERVVVSGWIDGHEEIVDGDGTRGLVGLELRTTKKASWRLALMSEVGPAGDGFGVMLGHSFMTGGSSGYRGVLR